MAADLVGVVESIYRFQGSERAWLARILDTLRPHLNYGFGMAGYFFDPRATPRLLIQDLTLVDMDERWKPDLLRLLSAMQEGDERVPLLLASDGFLTASEGMAELLPSMPYFDRIARGTPIRDFLGLVATDPGGVGCVITAPRSERSPTSQKDRQTWGRVSAHIATALRLRRAMPALTDAARDGVEGQVQVEAILDPSGKVHHAEDRASSSGARESLRESVRGREKARGRLRHLDPEEALACWRALIAGRWSLIDQVESDGRRVVLALPNRVRVTPLQALTDEQAQVVGYVLLGHSNKYIAIELGLSESAVAMRLGRAMRSLGAQSRVELIERVRSALEDGRDRRS